MAFSASLEYLGVDSASIVPYKNAQVSGCIIDFHFNPARAGMAEGVGHRLTANAGGLIANSRMQSLRQSFGHDAEIDSLVLAKLLPDSRKCLFDIWRRALR